LFKPVIRPRRMRVNKGLRNIIREVTLETRQLIYPIFVSELVNEPKEIPGMPGQIHWTSDRIHEPVLQGMRAGIGGFLLFGVPAKKDGVGSIAASDDSIVCKAIKNIKKHAPEAYIITDVCLCSYLTHGHCGILCENGSVDNDLSASVIAKVALAHAKAGADMVAPSDMMDGRVGQIREVLDANGFENVPIMSYSAKYASAFYGPFRAAADSAPIEGETDRKGYQMDPAVKRDAMLELELDLAEGADILMVKPGLPFLDILARARDRFEVPLAVYQVSGEYCMLKAAFEAGYADQEKALMETMISFRRAGADMIITYFAFEVAEYLHSGKYFNA